MTTWWAMPTSQRETCWTISSRPMATSQRSTWRSTSSTCAEPGIPRSQWILSSSRFKTVLTIRRQEASPSVPRSRSTLGMQKYLQHGTSLAPVAVGMRNQPLTKLGLTSNNTLQPLTISTSKCREKPLQTPDTTQLTPP
jgi:hypothetical protein